MAGQPLVGHHLQRDRWVRDATEPRNSIQGVAARAQRTLRSSTRPSISLCSSPSLKLAMQGECGRDNHSAGLSY